MFCVNLFCFRKRLPDFTQRALVKAGILVQVRNCIYALNNKLNIRGAIKRKKLGFFEHCPKGGGGGLVDSKISLTEKTQIFLDFLAERGGGLTQSKRVLAENWAKYPKNRIFFGYFAQKLRFFWHILPKSGA